MPAAWSRRASLSVARSAETAPSRQPRPAAARAVASSSGGLARARAAHHVEGQHAGLDEVLAVVPGRAVVARQDLLVQLHRDQLGVAATTGRAHQRHLHVDRVEREGVGAVARAPPARHRPGSAAPRRARMAARQRRAGPAGRDPRHPQRRLGAERAGAERCRRRSGSSSGVDAGQLAHPDRERVDLERRRAGGPRPPRARPAPGSASTRAWPAPQQMRGSSSPSGSASSRLPRPVSRMTEPGRSATRPGEDGGPRAQRVGAERRQHPPRRRRPARPITALPSLATSRGRCRASRRRPAPRRGPGAPARRRAIPTLALGRQLVERAGHAAAGRVLHGHHVLAAGAERRADQAVDGRHVAAQVALQPQVVAPRHHRHAVVADGAGDDEQVAGAQPGVGDHPVASAPRRRC